MHQQLWLDLWHHFLAVMSAEAIQTRIAISIALAFLAVMSLTGIADSFLPRRAARRYAAMYDLATAIAQTPPQQDFTLAPPLPVEEPMAVRAEEPEEPESSVNAATGPRRSSPPQPTVFRAQKP